MSFVELPDGKIFNTNQIEWLQPLTSGYTRVVFSSGEGFDLSEEHTKVLKKALIPPKTKTPRIVKNKEKSA